MRSNPSIDRTSPRRLLPSCHTFGGTSAMRAVFATVLLLPSLAAASGTLVPDLEQRLRTDGVESVNAQLSAQGLLMAMLNQSAADCDPQAIELTVKLSRTKHARAGELHNESLRVAVGTCTELVLSLLSPAEVPRICASVSTWTVTETARELRRRIGQIEIDERIRPIRHGRTCRAAYQFELQNTRVGLKVRQPNRQSK